ncbi:hypothetical protein HDU76_010420 [Blyttiomyces sp. JEL0837]|nr:hypothetical protein HDU76_010420 [Blyttiomyces sp. JEL0837]
MLFQTIITLITAAVSVSALPGGAPKCKINPMVIKAGHEVAASTNLGYQFQAPATYTPGGPPVAINIVGGPAFKGILLYMTKGTTQDANLAPNGLPEHVGVFAVNTGLRAQTTASCAALNVMNDAPESTLTHAMPLRASTPYTLMWTPPKTNAGVVTMNAVISVGSEESPWMVVPSIQLMSTAGNAGVAMAGANVTAPVANPQQPAANVPQQPAANVPQQPAANVPQQPAANPQQPAANIAKAAKKAKAQKAAAAVAPAPAPAANAEADD